MIISVYFVRSSKSNHAVYYSDRGYDFELLCLHDSTLSFASHALFALQNGIKEKGYDYLYKAMLLDLRDVINRVFRLFSYEHLR